MTALQKAEALLGEMSRGEKAQLLQWVVRDLGGDVFAGIDFSPQVAGGVACIVRTRIPVWTLVLAKKLGSSEAELLQAYPSLKAEDLANAWAYYRLNAEEIERQIVENENV